jgi:hypothetical protein
MQIRGEQSQKGRIRSSVVDPDTQGLETSSRIRNYSLDPDTAPDHKSTKQKYFLQFFHFPKKFTSDKSVKLKIGTSCLNLLKSSVSKK